MLELKQHNRIFRYGGKDIPFYYWSKTSGKTPPDTVLFLGAGQVDKIPYWIARSADPGIVVVGGVPHWEADPDANDIEIFCRQYVANAFRMILKESAQGSMHVIAESQAAPAAIRLADTMPEKIRNFALIRPLGFTVEAFGKSTEERLKSFQRRIRRTWLQFPGAFLGDPRNLTVSIIAWRAMQKEPSRKAFNQKYGAGISYDVTDDCRSAAEKLCEQGSTFTMFLGEKDRIFPPGEILQTLQLTRIEYVKTVILRRTPHASLATTQGRTVLRKVRAALGKNHATIKATYANTPSLR